MYIKYNANPLNKTSSSDCVIRAISKSLCKPYDEVYTDLFNIGFEMKNLPNAQSVYERYFKEIGYVRNKQPKKSDNTKYSVSEFASLHNKGIYIITIQGHKEATAALAQVDLKELVFAVTHIVFHIKVSITGKLDLF